MTKIKVTCNHCGDICEWYESWMHETSFEKLDEKWYCEECRQKFIEEWAVAR